MDMSFPQRIRCGLIEATFGVVSKVGSILCFRSEFAAASLKLGPLPSTFDSANGFRSEFAAASLKHRTVVEFRHGCVSFRSEFAAASLKLHRIANGSTMTVRFRSEFAAASLKRVGVGKRLSQHQEFPQRIRCGLIEAALATCAPMRCCSVSAANSLRPH